MSKAKSDGGIRIIVFRDGDSWIAQCLEYDICAQASDLDELRSRIAATIEAERDFSRQSGKKPFEGIAPSPKHYFDMWEKRSTFTSGPEEVGGKVELALCA